MGNPRGPGGAGHAADHRRGRHRAVKADRGGDDLRRTEATLTDAIAHGRNLLITDLSRLKDTQEADRALARSRTDDLERQLDHMVRRIEATLDGISDHGELMAGLRALVRIVRSEPV
jgi:hypothetical protein